ncbi:MAG: anaerobic ribonucleoside-triphosphate reductase activating protein [Eubacteriales bacterium]|nr:anaerobic ribonucleoside-triphosphate reductase activating protein [Eubacteriales bacterium]
MKICGYQKTTLLDYPGKVACTLFLAGCNFRCPFCHNGALVTDPDAQREIPAQEFFSFLEKRRGILDGVCISGGEPTLSQELPWLIRQIRKMGFAVKLDTNGSRPDVLRELVSQGLLDKVAMDIKACPEHYGTLCGLRYPDMDRIRESVSFLMSCQVEHEFRTTVVKELHTEQDFIEIGKWLAGAKAYYLQAYKDSEGVLQPGFHSYSLEELSHFRSILLQTISSVEIRGIH